jgi:putative transposase
MARPLRIEYEGAFYHVTSRGNKRKEIFRTCKTKVSGLEL